MIMAMTKLEQFANAVLNNNCSNVKGKLPWYYNKTRQTNKLKLRNTKMTVQNTARAS